MSRRAAYVLIAFMMFALGGVIVALLPEVRFLRGFVSDVAVVIFLVALLRVALPYSNIGRLALWVFLLAAVVELLQLAELADRLLLTGLARTAFGATFDPLDILAYAIGAGLAVVIDKWLAACQQSKQSREERREHGREEQRNKA